MYVVLRREDKSIQNSYVNLYAVRLYLDYIYKNSYSNIYKIQANVSEQKM